MMDDAPQSRQSLSEDQRTLLLRLVKKMLGMGKYPSEIKQAVSQKFHLSRRSVERYMKRARREMVENLNIPVKEHRAEALYFYRSVVSDPNSSQRERLRARERIDKLLGLDIPAKIQVEDEEFDLTPAQIQALSDEELEIIYKKSMKPR